MKPIFAPRALYTLLVLLALSGAGCRAIVTVLPEEATLEAGETLTLEAVSTSNRDTAFLWSSADPQIVMVDETGMVTGLNEGSTTLTARGATTGAEGHASITVNLPDDFPPELKVIVDPDVVPGLEELPPVYEGGPPRNIAAILDEEGYQAEFVADELILATDDMDALLAFIERWNGELLWTVDASLTDLEMPQMHLVWIDTSLGNPEFLEADILALEPGIRGEFWVSSEQGLALIAAGAGEALAGMAVGMNWVGEGNSLHTGSTTEAATGPGGFNSAGSGYSSNAFDWNFLDAGSTQDIGVTEAWRLLARTRKLSNRVKIAILDMGFSVAGNADLPSGWTAISNVPFVNPVNTSNLLKCSGGNACPWHGTDVLGAAMGVPDNAFGGAGPAGPVAEPIMVFTLYDFFSGISALVEARALGARVVNMSYGTRVPAILTFSVVPFNLATAASSRSMLLFASAGNSGANVDARRCFIVCWERAWWTPCENAGVMCVGGLARDSKSRDSASNYGSNDVDIFAPFSVIVGPNPASGPGAHRVNGTSVSSPYVAGVAGLVLAANPSLSPSQVQAILRTTAHSSPDSTVPRYVNAHEAVSRALPAMIVIESPETGDPFSGGGWPVYFDAFVHEAGRGTPTVQWRSSIDGSLGTGTSISHTGLSFGTHSIRAQATFPNGTTVQDFVNITIVDDPPTVTITSPLNNAEYFQGQQVLLAGTSFDLNEPGTQLADGQLSWYVDNVFIGNGHAHAIPAGTLSLGVRVIKLVGTDGTSSDTKTVNITILANPPNLPPDVVTIVHPPQGHYFTNIANEKALFFFDMVLEGNAHDPEDGVLTGESLVWTMRVDNGPVQTLGTGTNLTKKTYISQGQWTYDITLTATDSEGSSSSATVKTYANLILK